jgi:hypothetical protein
MADPSLEEAFVICEKDVERLTAIDRAWPNFKKRLSRSASLALLGAVSAFFLLQRQAVPANSRS